ncbi:hypothetical protein IU450_13205 [Nocardia abscessus]|uniref:hypothetical protein n=1 Tax=Nocardia abscessus TaxID=120957 RepID=UPI0018955A70|nr:hypothetical protein [Nocardia abscessus]MBF6336842.1 hypothetical protein [Nocardia abscessus]
MSKAHVPPQCAGNEGAVTRGAWMRNGSTVSLGRADEGGIWFLGQCRSCNSAAGRRFDQAYGELAAALRPLWLASLTRQSSAPMPIPSVAFNPGAVVRSLLAGMCATTMMLRQEWADVARLLDPASAIELPPDWKLCLAMTKGKTAWVSGTSAGGYLNGPQSTRRAPDGGPRVLMTWASVFFPPLAWHLVGHGQQMLLEEGWIDVSRWCAIAPTETRDLTEFASALPLVRHPRHEINGDHHWGEMLQHDVSLVAECFDVTDSSSDEARARRRLMSRRMVSMEDFEAAAMQRGITFEA